MEVNLSEHLRRRVLGSLDHAHYELLHEMNGPGGS